MYLRAAHVEQRIPALRQFIKANPLGVITTGIRSALYPFLQSSHVPWLLDVTDDESETELGVLRGHLARANPQAKAIIESLTGEDSQVATNGTAVNGNGNQSSNGNATQLSDEVMVLFTAPAHHYVTPKFYTSTKPTTGKVVPTWNYAAVQAYGRATVFFDAKADETVRYLSKQIRDLSRMTEVGVMGYLERGTGGGSRDVNEQGQSRPEEWQVDDAPEKYVDLLMKAIIGIQIEVTSLGGKFKMSQELSDEDREGVMQGFAKLNTETGSKISETVKERAEIKKAAAAAEKTAKQGKVAS